MGENRPDELYAKLVRFIVPDSTVATTPLPPRWLWFLAVPLFVVALACYPPVREWILANHLTNEDKIYLNLNRYSIVSWMEFVRIFAEVLLAIFVGGQVFNETMRSSAKNILSALQGRIDEAYMKQTDEIRNELIALNERLRMRLFGKFPLTAILLNLWEILRIVHRMQQIFFLDIRHLYIKMLFVRMYYVFPGGLYGLGAYTFFLTVLLMKCAKYYLDGVRV